MTIRVTIKNEDSGDREILAQQRSRDGSVIVGFPAKRLKGGETAEFYVHDSNSIFVTESEQDKPVPGPPAVPGADKDRQWA